MHVHFTTQFKKGLKKRTGLHFKSELTDHVTNNSGKKYNASLGEKTIEVKNYSHNLKVS